jgi:ribosome-associated protein
MTSEIELLIQEFNEKKAEEVVCVDLNHPQHPVADYVIIASSLNDVHLKSLVDHIQRFYKDNKKDKLNQLDFVGTSGKPDSKWVILDFNDLIIHVMDQSIRSQYDFDNLFAEYEIYRYH